jgi:hypothetical protein
MWSISGHEERKYGCEHKDCPCAEWNGCDDRNDLMNGRVDGECKPEQAYKVVISGLDKGEVRFALTNGYEDSTDHPVL